MRQDHNQAGVDKLLADASRALALVDLIIERDDPETSALALHRGTEACDDLLKRAQSSRFSEADQAVFLGMVDRLKARLRSLSGKPPGFRH